VNNLFLVNLVFTVHLLLIQLNELSFLAQPALHVLKEVNHQLFAYKEHINQIATKKFA